MSGTFKLVALKRCNGTDWLFALQIGLFGARCDRICHLLEFGCGAPTLYIYKSAEHMPFGAWHFIVVIIRAEILGPCLEDPIC
jgi:hypothetical protein